MFLKAILNYYENVDENKFKSFCVDDSGLIDFDQCLELLYNYNPPNKKTGLNGIGKICYDIANQIKYIDSLNLAEQLESGLF